MQKDSYSNALDVALAIEPVFSLSINLISILSIEFFLMCLFMLTILLEVLIDEADMVEFEFCNDGEPLLFKLFDCLTNGELEAELIDIVSLDAFS